VDSVEHRNSDRRQQAWFKRWVSNKADEVLRFVLKGTATNAKGRHHCGDHRMSLPSQCWFALFHIDTRANEAIRGRRIRKRAMQ
jgi:hypothetical protein